MTAKEFKDKFVSLATITIAEKQALNIIDTVYNLESLESIDGLTDLIKM